MMTTLIFSFANILAARDGESRDVGAENFPPLIISAAASTQAAAAAAAAVAAG